MEILKFEPGPVSAGKYYSNDAGDVLEALRNIASAKAQPKAGFYWKLIGTAKEYQLLKTIEHLKLLISQRDEEIARLKGPQEKTIDMASGYGIGPDDCTDKLMHFREENQANYGLHLNLHFPKEFNYRNNRFLFGLISYTCYLNGGRWEVDYSGTDEKLQRAIFAGSMFHTNTLEYVGRNDYHYGFKIRTAEEGATEVYLKEPSNLKAGERCLIYGFDHIVGDDPPGTKYNQYMEIGIRTIDGDKITLSEPLKHRYDENWIDFPDVKFGKPRIISLDRIDYRQPKRAELIGGTITGSLQMLADNVLLQDLIVEGYFWPGLSKSTIAVNCHFKGGVEFDKVGGELICYNCTFDKHVTNGTGFDFIGLYDCTFMEGYEIASRRYEVKNATVIAGWKSDKYYAPVAEPPAQSAVDRATFEGHKITRAEGNLADTAFDIKRKKAYTLVRVEDGKIVIPYKHTEGDEWSALVRCTEFNRSGRETELFTTDGRKGIIQNITEGANNTCVVHCTVPDLKPGDTLYWYPLREIVDEGAHVVGPEFLKGVSPV